jgi:hypothetical protein
VVLMTVLGCGGEGQADGAVPGCFDVEEERGVGMEAHTDDMEEGTRWRSTRRRSGHRRMCGRKMTGLRFRGSGTLEKKNSSDGHDDVINVCRYI